MSTAPRILLIGGNHQHFAAAKAAGLEVVYCQFPDKFTPEHGKQVEGAILVDYTDWTTFRPLVLAAHQAWGFSAVVSLTEPGLDPAGRVSDLLGLGGTSYRVSHRFTDKYLMRQRIAQLAPPLVPVIGARIATGPDSMREFGAKYGYPFIIKPRSGTASFGARKVRGASGVDGVWAEIGAERADSSHPDTPFYDLDEYVMEEYADGTLYSTEAFSFDGRHTVIAITEAITDEANQVHAGHAVPARLDADVEESLIATTMAFLDAMGYRDGPSHTEIKLGGLGAVVIESHNRIGGALINEMVEAVTGVNMQALTMGWPHRGVAELPTRPVASAAAASWLVVAQPGEITEVSGVAELHDEPSTLAIDLWSGPGDVVRSVNGSWDGLGHVAVRAADTTTAIQDCLQKLAGITVHTRAGKGRMAA